nr:type I polyketide synthase [uncultured Pseudomonas sp.]
MNRLIPRHADYRNMLELVEDRASVLADKPLYTFLRDNLDEAGVMSFDGLRARAMSLAAELQQLAQPGERVLLLFPAGLAYIEAFFACLYAGLVAVPAYAIQSPKDHDRLNSIVRDAGAKLILTTQEQEPATAAWLARGEIHAPLVLCSDTLERRHQWQQPDIGPDTLAFLQYTSGSTGSPKGVMVSHRNLLHNSELSYRAFNHSDATVGASWLPPYHDMGLIGGVLQPLFAGIPVYLMSPMTFLKRPIRWLETISRYGVSSSGAPNFAYDFCVRRVSEAQRDSLDLSSWRVAFNGAEPIHHETQRRFADYFASAGFRPQAMVPCYGLAEATLLVSANSFDAGPLSCAVDAAALEGGVGLAQYPLEPLMALESAVDSARQILISSGEIAYEHCAIVNPETSIACPDGSVGEIWLQGSSVAQGYWNKPQETRETFAARIQGQDGEYLRTGDLGYRLGDQLIVTGRLKELIIINGRNLYPQDLERGLQQSDERLREGHGAAVGLLDSESGTERLVIIQEVERKIGDEETLRGLADGINACLQERFQVTPYATLLIAASSLPKTTSGKIQRRKALQQMNEGSLNLLYDSRERAALQAAAPVTTQASERVAAPSLVSFSQRQWEAQLAVLVKAYMPEGTSPERDQPFQSMGLDSKQAVSIVGELEDLYGRSLNATLLFDYPSIAALAAYLAGVDSQAGLAESRPVATAEPLAIVGMACRFPGAQDLDGFWRLLLGKENAIQEIPAARWDWRAVQGENGEAGTSRSAYGGFIEDVEGFDAAFFGITPKEARLMDPQQRILLQTVWHALEDAGLSVDTLRGRPVGVYVGASTNDYSRLLANTADAVSPWSGTSNALCILANRVSYLLGFNGPSITSDTACSSSLTSLHLAAQGLRAGESELAVVAGVNLMLIPELHVIFSQAGMLAPDGQCKTFDDAADGYVRGEGCGVVVLKPLAQAQRDRDRIYGVVDASQINQDGASNGLTAPNALSQQMLMRDALAKAGKAADAIQYVECHGTGTSLGDPIELHSLDAVYGQQRSGTLRLGSVKTNIGHLEAAAGIAGVIKAALMLHHRVWIPSLNVQTPTRHFDWAGSPLRIQQEVEAFSDAASVAVSGFGFGGSNAHVILSSAAQQDADVDSAADSCQLITLSARHPESLRLLTEAYSQRAQAGSVAALARASRRRRGHLAYRNALLVGPDRTVRLATGTAAEPARRAPTAWLFTGQGSQYLGMARQLYQTQPGFRAILDRLAATFDELLPQPLLSILWEEPAHRLADTRFTQPALFALEVALARLWQSWGLQPDMLLGHSVGEFAAACIAGVFSEADGIRLIAARGRLMADLCTPGAMTVVMAAQNQVETWLPAYPGLSIAALNGPSAQVVAGEASAMQDFIGFLQQQNIKHQALDVSHAFHSALMTPMLDAFREVASTITYQTPQIPLVSNISGRLAGAELASADYWVRHVMAPVQYHAAICEAERQGITTWLEIGPDRTLLGMARMAVSGDAEHRWLSSLSRKQEDNQTLLDSLAQLYCLGHEVDWCAFDGQTAAAHTPLPLYPFRAVPHWIASGGEQTWLQQRNPLGQRYFMAPSQVVYQQSYQGQQPYDLGQHAVNGQTLLAAASHVVAFLELAVSECPQDAVRLSDIEIGATLSLAEHPTTSVQYQLDTASGQLQAYAMGEQGSRWNQLAVARLSQEPARPAIARPAALTLDIPASALYDALWQGGYHYGPSFRWLERIGLAPDAQEWQALGEWRAPLDLDQRQRKFSLAPGMLDSFLHMASVLHGPLAEITRHDFLYLPVAIESFWIDTAAMASQGVVGIQQHSGVLGDKFLSYRIAVWNDAGQLLLELDGLKLRRISKRLLQGSQAPQVQTCALTWQAVAAQPGQVAAEQWAVQLFGNAVPSAWLERLSQGIEPVGVQRVVGASDKRFERHILLLAVDAGLADLHALWQQLQSWQAQGADAPREVIVIAPQALQAQGEPCLSALVAGWLRALNNESRGIKARLIDTQWATLDLQRLVQEVFCRNPEAEVRLDGLERWVPRWQALAPQAPALAAEDCALVTGASGDIGLRLIERLARRGVKTIVAVSRQAQPAALAETLRGTGARLIWLQADIDDAASLRAAFVGVTLPQPIQSLYHVAGSTIDAAFADATWQDFESIAQAKVTGTLNLLQLAQALPAQFQLSRWLLFSSISAVTGSFGQAHYAAANAFLDHAAQAIRASGIEAVSINWGPWQNTRMVRAVEKQRGLRERAGLYAMSDDAAFSALERLQGQSANLMIAAVDWSLFQQMPGGDQAKFEGLSGAPLGAASEAEALLAQLAAQQGRERQRLLVELLTARVRTAMELEDDAYIDADSQLQSLGMDSLIAVDLRNHLNNITGLKLSATLLFDYPTINAIAEHLLQQLFPVTQVAADEPAAVPPEWADLNEEKLDAFLADLIEE